MLMQVKFPHKEFNAAVRDGNIGQKLNKILEEMNPEAVYFTEYDGQREVIMVFDLKDQSETPTFAER